MSIWRHWPVAAITASAIIIRLPALLHGGLWKDDAYTYVDITAGSWSSLLQHLAITEAHPPLFFVLMYGWVKIFGVSELALSLPAFVCGIVMVPVVYRLGVLAHSRQTGLLAAIFCAAAPHANELSSQARPYALSALLCAVLVTLVLSATRGMTRPLFAGIAVTTALLVYTHYVGLIAVGALAIWTFAVPQYRLRAPPIAAALGLGMLPFVLILHRFATTAATQPLRPPGSGFSDAIIIFASHLREAAPVEADGLAVAFWFALLAAAALVSARRRTLTWSTFLLATVCLSAFLVEAFAHMAEVRYAYPFFPCAWTVFAAIFVEAALSLKTLSDVKIGRWAFAFAAAMLCILIAADVSWAREAWSVPRSGVRSLAASGVETHSVYLFAPDVDAATFYYYSRAWRPPIDGFPRIRHPEISRFADYIAVRQDRRLLPIAESLAASYPRRGLKRLHYVIDEDAIANRTNSHSGYGMVWNLFDFVKRKYHLRGCANYHGRLESVSDCVFVLGG